MKAFVYFNLHKKMWSVRVDGKVMHHVNQILLKDCKLKVSKAGNARVRAEGRKNVHAGVLGTVVGMESLVMLPDGESQQVTYNPYKMDTFQTMDGSPVHTAGHVFLTNRKAWAYP